MPENTGNFSARTHYALSRTQNFGNSGQRHYAMRVARTRRFRSNFLYACRARDCGDPREGVVCAVCSGLAGGRAARYVIPACAAASSPCPSSGAVCRPCVCGERAGRTGERRVGVAGGGRRARRSSVRPGTRWTGT